MIRQKFSYRFALIAFALVAAVITVSCEKGESAMSEGIQFSNVLISFGRENSKEFSVSTKSDVNETLSATVYNDKQFRVSCLYERNEMTKRELFSNAVVKRLDSEVKFKSSVYWPMAGTCSFYAVWPVDYELQKSDSFEYSVQVGNSTTAFAGDKDIVVARYCKLKLDDTEEGSGDVPITFNHILIYVKKISAKVLKPAATSDVLKVVIDSITFLGAPQYGTYRINNSDGDSKDGTWTGITGSQNVSIALNNTTVSSAADSVIVAPAAADTEISKFGCCTMIPKVESNTEASIFSLKVKYKLYRNDVLVGSFDETEDKIQLKPDLGHTFMIIFDERGMISRIDGAFEMPYEEIEE